MAAHEIFLLSYWSFKYCGFGATTQNLKNALLFQISSLPRKKKARRLRPKGGAVCAILDHFCFVGSQKDPGMRKRWVRCLEK